MTYCLTLSHLIQTVDPRGVLNLNRRFFASSKFISLVHKYQENLYRHYVNSNNPKNRMACSLSLISVFNGTKSNNRTSKSEAIMYCLSLFYQVHSNYRGHDLLDKRCWNMFMTMIKNIFGAYYDWRNIFLRRSWQYCY